MDTILPIKHFGTLCLLINIIKFTNQPPRELQLPFPQYNMLTISLSKFFIHDIKVTYQVYIQKSHIKLNLHFHIQNFFACIGFPHIYI